MPIVRFPNPEDSSPEGLIAVGGDLHPESLLLAYRQGIFPWPVHDPDAPGRPPVLAWFCPPERAILDFNEIHLPRSLEKARRKGDFTYTIDKAFAQVIVKCSLVPRPGQSGTWITPQIIKAYVRFHNLGFAHSVEAWRGDTLVGGIYGIAIDGAFAGESMFHDESNASKLALLTLIDHLKSKGLSWMDIQAMTPHMKALGAKLIPRRQFLDQLAETRTAELSLF